MFTIKRKVFSLLLAAPRGFIGYPAGTFNFLGMKIAYVLIRTNFNSNLSPFFFKSNKH